MLPYPVSGTMIYPSNWGSLAMPNTNESQVRGLPALQAGVNKISNGVASMAPPHCFAADGITRVPGPLVLERPWTGLDVFAYWHQAVSSVIMRGNFVALQWAPEGVVEQLIPVSMDVTDIRYDAAGYKVFDIQGRTYSAEQVFHVPGLVVPGNPKGIGIVENFRRALGAQLDAQQYGASALKVGGVPSGLVQLAAKEVSEEQAKFVQEQWTETHGGQRKVAVLPQTMTFTPLSWSPEDAQFIEARQLGIAEAALMVGLMPSDLGASVGAGSSLTYANLEQDRTRLVTDAYGPYMRRFEQAFQTLLDNRYIVRLNAEDLLRTDTKSRYEGYKIALEGGWLTINEIRKLERLPEVSNV